MPRLFPMCKHRLVLDSMQEIDSIESELEIAINDLKIIISKGNPSEILEQVDDTRWILEERNNKCKACK